MSLVISLSLLIGLILLVTKTVAVILKLDEGEFGWTGMNRKGSVGTGINLVKHQIKNFNMWTYEEDLFKML